MICGFRSSQAHLLRARAEKPFFWAQQWPTLQRAITPVIYEALVSRSVGARDPPNSLILSYHVKNPMGKKRVSPRYPCGWMGPSYALRFELFQVDRWGNLMGQSSLKLNALLVKIRYGVTAKFLRECPTFI